MVPELQKSHDAVRCVHHCPKNKISATVTGRLLARRTQSGYCIYTLSQSCRSVLMIKMMKRVLGMITDSYIPCTHCHISASVAHCTVQRLSAVEVCLSLSVSSEVVCLSRRRSRYTPRCRRRTNTRPASWYCIFLLPNHCPQHVR